MGVAVGTASVFGITKMDGWIEVFYFAADFAVVGSGVEGGHVPDTGFSSYEIAPEGGHIITDGGNGTHACDDDAAGIHKIRMN